MQFAHSGSEEARRLTEEAKGLASDTWSTVDSQWMRAVLQACKLAQPEAQERECSCLHLESTLSIFKQHSLADTLVTKCIVRVPKF